MGSLPGAKIGNTESMLTKNAVNYTEGAALVHDAADVDGMTADMPAGAAALVFAGVSMETKTGDGKKRIEVVTSGERVPMVAAEAMNPGQRVEIAGVTGKVRIVTVEGAVIGRVKTKATADGQRVYVKLGGE